eukprot:m.78826 g.78826  ORF g.78826 m.78826 type:complete len:498 (-) comp12691_c0_seq2:103-1596(-)
MTSHIHYYCFFVRIGIAKEFITFFSGIIVVQVFPKKKTIMSIEVSVKCNMFEPDEVEYITMGESFNDCCAAPLYDDISKSNDITCGVCGNIKNKNNDTSTKTLSKRRVEYSITRGSKEDVVSWAHDVAQVDDEDLAKLLFNKTTRSTLEALRTQSMSEIRNVLSSSPYSLSAGAALALSQQIMASPSLKPIRELRDHTEIVTSPSNVKTEGGIIETGFYSEDGSEGESASSMKESVVEKKASALPKRVPITKRAEMVQRNTAGRQISSSRRRQIATVKQTIAKQSVRRSARDVKKKPVYYDNSPDTINLDNPKENRTKKVRALRDKLKRKRPPPSEPDIAETEEEYIVEKITNLRRSDTERTWLVEWGRPKGQGQQHIKYERTYEPLSCFIDADTNIVNKAFLDFERNRTRLSDTVNLTWKYAKKQPGSHQREKDGFDVYHCMNNDTIRDIASAMKIPEVDLYEQNIMKLGYAEVKMDTPLRKGTQLRFPKYLGDRR